MMSLFLLRVREPRAVTDYRLFLKDWMPAAADTENAGSVLVASQAKWWSLSRNELRHLRCHS